MTSSMTPDEAAETAAPLDVLLVDAALGPVRRFAPDVSTVKLMAGLARHPLTTSRRVGALGAEAGRIAAGTSTYAPSKRDRRFADQAWTENPLLRRLLQAYLAAGKTAEQLVADAQLEWRDDQRMRFVVDNLVEALAPSNLPVRQPRLGQGSHRHRGHERRARRGPVRQGHGVGAAHPGDGRPVGVHRRGQRRGHPRRGRAAHRGVRADPVHAADRAGARGAAR